MENLIKLQNDKKKWNETYKQRITERKSYLHKKYIQTHKKFFIAMDILFICCILCNIGALFLTNIAVGKVYAEENIDFVEANPVAAQLHSFETVEKTSFFKQAIDYVSLLKQAIIWFFWTYLYLRIRKSVYSDEGKWSLMFILTFWLCFTSWDFLRDLALVLGKFVIG